MPDSAACALTIVECDGELQYRLTCPTCGTRGEIDREQAQGQVSVVCANPACDYHETVNWLARTSWQHEYLDFRAWELVLGAVRNGHATLGGAAAMLGVSDLEVEERL